MKVLHLPLILCNVISETVYALNRIGVETDYMVIDSQDSEWLLTENNIKYSLEATKLARSSRDARKMRLALQSFFLKAIEEYDVFHFHSGVTFFSSSLGHTADLEILKKTGKVIAVSFWGCDARFKKINSKYQYNTCEVCKIGCDEPKKTKLITEIKKYADIITIPTGEYASTFPKAKLWNPIVNTEFWQSSSRPDPKSETIKIFHPFGNAALRGDVKGSVQIDQAITRLREEGYKIELLKADKVKNADLKPIYVQADIVIEQLRAGWLGATGREALSMGKPVITYLRKDSLKGQIPPPVINANPDNIYEELKKLIDDDNLRLKLARQARKYSLKVSNPVIQAKKLEQWYKIAHKSKRSIISKEEILSVTRKAVGFNVLILRGNKIVGEDLNNLAKELGSAGFHTTTMGGKPFNRLFRQSFSFRPDVIIATNLKTLFVGSLIKTLKGCSLIFVWNGNSLQTGNSIKKTIFLWGKRIFLKRADYTFEIDRKIAKRRGNGLLLRASAPMTDQIVRVCSKLTSTKDTLWQENPGSVS